MEENSLLPVVIMICLNTKYVHVQNISLCKYNPVKASRSRLYFENMQLVHPTVSHRPPVKATPQNTRVTTSRRQLFCDSLRSLWLSTRLR